MHKLGITANMKNIEAKNNTQFVVPLIAQNILILYNQSM